MRFESNLYTYLCRPVHSRLDSTAVVANPCTAAHIRNMAVFRNVCAAVGFKAGLLDR